MAGQFVICQALVTNGLAGHRRRGWLSPFADCQLVHLTRVRDARCGGYVEL